MSRITINEALFLARVYWRLTQEEMAKRLDISQSYLSEIENSKAEISYELLRKYSSVLNIKISTLVAFSENLEHKTSTRVGRKAAKWAVELLASLVPEETLRSERG